MWFTIISASKILVGSKIIWQTPRTQPYMRCFGKLICKQSGPGFWFNIVVWELRRYIKRPIYISHPKYIFNLQSWKFKNSKKTGRGPRTEPEEARAREARIFLRFFHGFFSACDEKCFGKTLGLNRSSGHISADSRPFPVANQILHLTLAGKVARTGKSPQKNPENRVIVF